MSHTASQCGGGIPPTAQWALTHPLHHPHYLSHDTVLTCHFIDQEMEAQLQLSRCPMCSTPSYKVHFAPLYYMLNFMTFEKRTDG